MEKKLPKLTKKQRVFVKEYLETGNGQKAALKAFDIGKFGAKDPANSARAVASETLTRPNVIAYLESKADKAAEFVYELASGAENEGVRLNASKDILDRTGFKVPEPSKDTEQGATYNFIFSEQTRGEVAEIEARIRARLIGINNAEEIEEVMETEQEGPG